MALLVAEEDDPAEGAFHVLRDPLAGLYIALAASLGFLAFGLITWGAPEFAIGVLFAVPMVILLAKVRTDWGREIDGRRIAVYTGLGVVGLMLISGVYTAVKLSPAFINVTWPGFSTAPIESTLLTAAGISLVTQTQRFTFDFLSALFFVAPGEEAAKAVPWLIFKVHGGVERMPFFAFQIPVIIGIAFWGVFHALRTGGYGLDFAIPAIIAGIWIAEIGYLSGSFFTMIAAHGIFNGIGVIQQYSNLLQTFIPIIGVT